MKTQLNSYNVYRYPAETIRRWCHKYSLNFAENPLKKQNRLGDTWFMDEVFLIIKGQRHLFLARSR